jgi:hypothetical protein
MSSKAFRKVLQDNIAACLRAEYLNKAKLFQFIEQIIRDEITKLSVTERGEENEEEDITGARYGLNVYHAPQFVENNPTASEHYEDIQVTRPSLLL